MHMTWLLYKTSVPGNAKMFNWYNVQFPVLMEVEVGHLIPVMSSNG